MYQKRRSVQPKNPGKALEASIAIEFDLSLKYLDGASFPRQNISTNSSDLANSLPQQMKVASSNIGTANMG